jgi:two-component system phosphate regulon response regulator PhoB
MLCYRTVMSSLILIVEDEQDLLNTLEYNLQRDGYRTRCAANGKDAIALANERPVPDLVLLDLMLPDLSGTEVCRALRANERTRHVPVVMLTAKGEEIDRVVGFEIGADDYLVKPFSVRELALRIRAVLRRTQHSDDDAEQVEFGVLRVNPSAHRCWVEGEEVTLTALEFKLLTTLLERRGRVQTREVLLTDVWGFSAEVTTRTVDTHVKRLRQKIGPAGSYIETLRGVGYRFTSEPIRDSS